MHLNLFKNKRLRRQPIQQDWVMPETHCLYVQHSYVSFCTKFLSWKLGIKEKKIIKKGMIDGKYSCHQVGFDKVGGGNEDKFMSLNGTVKTELIIIMTQN